MSKWLEKKLEKKREHLSRYSKIISKVSIRPFEERPDVEQQDRIGAHDLFSMFTASIIKKKTTFTR